MAQDRTPHPLKAPLVDAHNCTLSRRRFVVVRVIEVRLVVVIVWEGPVSAMVVRLGRCEPRRSGGFHWRSSLELLVLLVPQEESLEDLHVRERTELFLICLCQVRDQALDVLSANELEELEDCGVKLTRTAEGRVDMCVGSAGQLNRRGLRIWVRL